MASSATTNNSRIKVIGYAQKVQYADGIEYRPFSPDLVGVQLASENGASLFTLGNFSVSTNLDPKPSKIFATNKYSNFISLDTLDLTTTTANTLLTKNTELTLKLDKTNLTNYAYFGSLVEYVRVALEDIIIKWPASLYIIPVVSNDFGTFTGYTMENYSYDVLSNIATFSVSSNMAVNKFGLNILTNGSIINTFNETNDLRNLTINYGQYVVFMNDVEYDILSFTGATTEKNGTLYFKIAGNPITGATTFSKYHIKPNRLKAEEFFNLLPDFESYLLNRLTIPQYTALFEYTTKSEVGLILNTFKELTWPVTDGYNIDFDSTDYVSYVNNLLEVAIGFDETKSNLMTRFLTTEAISDFDSLPTENGEHDESAGQKMTRTLKIYGREFDEIKRLITGIKFANTVTYDQKDNTPDPMLKYLARILGWELVSSIVENNLLKSYVDVGESTYSGHTRGLTPLESEYELWRRIILNSPWIWKSKGARKSIEFLFKFIGAPNGLVTFNEYIYVAKNKMDTEQFKLLLKANNLDTNVTNYMMDLGGYPMVKPNSSNMYFQKGGLWYRETAGSGAVIDILDGNNPHVGPYDGGFEYINQFNSLIPNFSATTLTGQTIQTETTNLFTNYKEGSINTYDGSYFVDILSENEVDLSDCIVVTPSKILDPFPSPVQTTKCGCNCYETDYALDISIRTPDELTNGEIKSDCLSSLNGSPTISSDGYYNFNYITYNENNTVYGSYLSKYTNKTCCNQIGGTPIYYETWYYNDKHVPYLLSNIGYICCKTGKCGCFATCDWRLSTNSVFNLTKLQPYNAYFIQFTKPNGERTIIIPNSCSCVATYSTPIQNVKDPDTNEVGVACMLTNSGVLEFGGVVGNTQPKNVEYTILNNSIVEVTDKIIPTGITSTNRVYLIYEERANGNINCSKFMESIPI